jgi:type VI protein secretion system component Hcp
VIRFNPRLRRFSVAAAILVLTAPPVRAEPPPSVPPSPRPMPYPNIAARDPATGLPTGKRMHKPILAAPRTIETLSLSWGRAGQPSVASSDPQEGGEVAAARPVTSADPMAGGQLKSADPEEGGEVTAAAKVGSSRPIAGSAELSNHLSNHLDAQAPGGATVAKVKVSDLNVTKHIDVSSAKLAEPAPAGTATVTVARGACATGQHIPEVKLTMRGKVYDLHDVDVSACTESGETSTCTLSYASIG